MPSIDTSLPIRIRRHATARRMILRLSPDGKQIHLTLPRRTSEKAGLAFVKSQELWILDQQRKQKERTPRLFSPGIAIPLFGQECLLCHQPGQRGTLYTVDKLIIGGNSAYFPRRVADWIKQEAQQRFGQLAIELAAQINQRPASVTLRDSKSRWGSCSKRRNINLSWRLALAPLSVARYVIIHEVAHLRHFNHSPAFWQQVAALDPEWEVSRNWLRHYGRTLHDYAATL